MVRPPSIEGNHHVAPFRNRSAYRSLVRRRADLRIDRRQRRYPAPAHRLIRHHPIFVSRRTFMGRSIVIGLAAFSTTVLLIVAHTGATLA
jgi:hypothetical protein